MTAVMKIVVTGGGSGGHFYPMISVIDKVREISEEKHLLQPEVIYMANDPYDADILFGNEIKFVKITSGKLSLVPSFGTILQIIKIFFGVISTLFKMIKIYPDVVFTNGGYVAFPVLFSARLLGIPVIIHVSDTIPSRVLLYAGKFAKKISIAFPEAEKYFDKDKVALIGNPIRDEIKYKQKDGAHSFFSLQPDVKTILIIGGSQGSQIINETVLSALPYLLKKYQIIHQTGKKNYDDVYKTAGVVLMDNPLKSRYRVYSYLNDLQMKMAAGAADLIVARAGAGSIAEISNWGIPSILIPLTKKISRDQESNSFSYARSGGAVVIRQANLTSHILINEINKIFENQELYAKMQKGAEEFFIPDAEKKIAVAILEVLISHQS